MRNDHWARVLGRRVRFVVRAAIRGRIGVFRHRLYSGLRNGQRGAVFVLRIPRHRPGVFARAQEFSRGAGRHSGESKSQFPERMHTVYQ